MDLLLNALILLGLFACAALFSYVIWPTHYSELAPDDHVKAIYKQIIASSGQAQDALPLVIDDSLIDNAYNDSTKIVIYRGLINHCSSWDEVALVLGHEVAHGMLKHFTLANDASSADDIAILEGNADKYGAFLAMKSGYDVCKGRLLFKHWREENGNALGQNHPDYSYRYDELDVGCD